MAGKSIISRIDTDGLEDLRILGQALSIEPRLGQSALEHVASRIVERPAPAGILPGGRSDVNALDRQGGQPAPLAPAG